MMIDHVAPPAHRRRHRHQAARQRGATVLGTVWAVLLLAVVSGPPVRAANLSRTATATATVNAVAKLSLSSNSLAFPDADPDTTPSIPASGGALVITAKARTTIGSTVSLTVRASDDLRSGLDRILATQLTWTATGTGFVDGTMSKTAAQPVGSWVSSGMWTGSQAYALANSWTYSTGTYTTTLTYTLSAP